MKTTKNQKQQDSRHLAWVKTQMTLPAIVKSVREALAKSHPRVRKSHQILVDRAKRGYLVYPTPAKSRVTA